MFHFPPLSNLPPEAVLPAISPKMMVHLTGNRVFRTLLMNTGHCMFGITPEYVPCHIIKRPDSHNLCQNIDSYAVDRVVGEGSSASSDYPINYDGHCPFSFTVAKSPANEYRRSCLYRSPGHTRNGLPRQTIAGYACCH